MAYTLLNGNPSVECFRGSFYKMRRRLGTRTAFGINEVRLPPGVEGHEHSEKDTGR